jgi:type III secretion protein C
MGSIYKIKPSTAGWRVACVIGVLVCFSAESALAEIAGDDAAEPIMLVPPISSDEQISYYLFDQTISNFLNELERSSGFRFQTSPLVKGRLRNLSISGTPSEVMDIIANDLGLDWYGFNDVIYVSTKAEAGMRVVRLGNLNADHALTVLRESGLSVDQYSVQVAAGGTALALSGPPTFLALAEAMIESIPEVLQATAVLASRPTVLVRRGINTDLEVVD